GDLDPGHGGAIRYATLGASPAREFVVEWRDVPSHDPGAQPATFQVILHESSDLVEMQVDNASAANATHVTGIENADGTSGLRYAYGAAYSLHHAGAAFVAPDHLGAPSLL